MSTLPNFPILNGLTPVTDKNGMPSMEFLRFLRNLHIMTWPNLTSQPTPGGPAAGNIRNTAIVQGRTEGIGITVQNLTNTGKVNSTDNVIDGTGSPLEGGKRGFVGFDATPRLASSFRNNAVNVSGTPMSASVLSNDGISTAIAIAASDQQFGPGTVSYASGSVDPGVFGSFFVFADDPNFAGGSVTYQVSSSAPDQTAADGRVGFGKITTAGGTPHTGGGNTGGDTPGGGGGRGYNPA